MLASFSTLAPSASRVLDRLAPPPAAETDAPPPKARPWKLLILGCLALAALSLAVTPSVPTYDPWLAFGPPVAGYGFGLSFGPRIAIGPSFAPWGWGGAGFGWPTHTILLGGRPWLRTYGSRLNYVHPYPGPRPPIGRPIERHELRPTRSFAPFSARGRVGGGPFRAGRR